MREGRKMNRDDFRRERLYQTSIAVARTMHKKGLISEAEFCQIDIIFLEKYRPILGMLKVGIQQKNLDFALLLSD